MHKQKIGVSLGGNYSIPIAEVLEIVKNVGFDAISPNWRSEDELENIVDMARGLGLELQSLHAPFLRAAAMWKNDTEVSGVAQKELLTVIDACVRFKIPVAVVHAWIGFDYKFDEKNLCFDAFDELVRYARERDVKIAFENTEGDEYLFALMEHFKNNSTVGFCWDSGHELCYNHSKDLLAEFGDRLVITHLNDNLGISRFDGKTYWTDDLHLLPFDGIADWDHNVERLRRSNRLDILNFELAVKSKPNRHENDVYTRMSPVEYFTEAYKRACKIAYRYSK